MGSNPDPSEATVTQQQWQQPRHKIPTAGKVALVVAALIVLLLVLVKIFGARELTYGETAAAAQTDEPAKAACANIRAAQILNSAGRGGRAAAFVTAAVQAAGRSNVPGLRSLASKPPGEAMGDLSSWCSIYLPGITRDNVDEYLPSFRKEHQEVLDAEADRYRSDDQDSSESPPDLDDNTDNAPSDPGDYDTDDDSGSYDSGDRDGGNRGGGVNLPGRWW